MFNTEQLLKETQLFWQYPVITEKEFYNQNNKNINYCGVPWATIIDKHIPINSVLKIILPMMKHKNYYTCCQHICFKRLCKLFWVLGIKTLYTPHKVIGENIINGITIKSCPLYAVNIENYPKNKTFENVDFIKKKRRYLYSFAGGYQKNYLTTIRMDIFNMKHPTNTYIQNTGDWHFNELVYNIKQNNRGILNISQNHKDKTETYNNLLLNSRYSLCPSGSGPNSIRFWESLAVGSIPVLLADTLDLPEHELWNKAIVRIKESDYKKIPEILNNISNEEENNRRINCIKIYNGLHL